MMPANLLKFEENGYNIWITIPPKVEYNKDGMLVQSSPSDEVPKVISLDRLYSVDIDRKHEAGADLSTSKLPFVWKLYEMLRDVEEAGQESIVSWVNDGKAFKVFQLEKFVETVIPKYCKLSKYKSFLRQLHFYGFTRIQSGPNKGAYYHPKFLRGKKSLCLSILPKNGRRRSSASSQASADSIKRTKFELENESCESSIVGIEMEPENESIELNLTKKEEQYPQPVSVTRDSGITNDSQGLHLIGSEKVNTTSDQLTDVQVSKDVDDYDSEVEYVFGGMAFHAVEGLYF